jgi:hypothetical protein
VGVENDVTVVETEIVTELIDVLGRMVTPSKVEAAATRTKTRESRTSYLFISFLSFCPFTQIGHSSLFTVEPVKNTG